MRLSKLIRECDVSYRKERTNIDVEPDISEGRGNDLASSVVPILTDLRHENARSTTLASLELLERAIRYEVT